MTVICDVAVRSDMLSPVRVGWIVASGKHIPNARGISLPLISIATSPAVRNSETLCESMTLALSFCSEEGCGATCHHEEPRERGWICHSARKRWVRSLGGCRAGRRYFHFAEHIMLCGVENTNYSFCPKTCPGRTGIICILCSCLNSANLNSLTKSNLLTDSDLRTTIYLQTLTSKVGLLFSCTLIVC